MMMHLRARMEAVEQNQIKARQGSVRCEEKALI